MNKPVLAVDVDETVAPAVKHWINWYHDLTGHDLLREIEEDNGKIEELMHNHRDPLKFWRQPNLYQPMLPRKGSVEVLQSLSRYFDVIFVSASMPEHSESKMYWLQKHFPFHKGYVATAEKQFVKCDVFIDDYRKYLDKVQNYQKDALCIQIQTKLNKAGEYAFVGWGDIIDEIKTKRPELLK